MPARGHHHPCQGQRTSRTRHKRASCAVTPGADRADRRADPPASCRHRGAAGRRPQVRAIAAELGLARNTVRRFAWAADPEELLVNDGTGRRRSMLDDHAPYLHQRWEQGCTDAAALWRELRTRGYPGGYARVRDYLLPWRDATATPAPAPPPPKARQATAWILTDPAHMNAHGTRQLAAITAECPELAAVQAHVQAFAQIPPVAGVRALPDG
jgi:transposase